MTLNAKRIYQSIYFHRLLLLDTLSIVCLCVCLLQNFEGVLKCLFIIKIACENQNQNTIYKSLNTKDKSKKPKVKTQKAKDNRGKKPL